MGRRSKNRKQSENQQHDSLPFQKTPRDIEAKTKNQQKLIDSIHKNEISFLVGPAGTGKTFLSLATAMSIIGNSKNNYKSLVIVRPQVATKKVGFLPGDEKDKNAPYMKPILYSLGKIIGPSRVQRMVNENRIQQWTLEYLRGMSIDNSIVILDEAQNVTRSEILMFLTRIGENTKFIITGDLDQTDLKPGEESGLKVSTERLRDVRGIGLVEFTDEDIVRNKLVKVIVNRFSESKWNSLQNSYDVKGQSEVLDDYFEEDYEDGDFDDEYEEDDFDDEYEDDYEDYEEDLDEDPLPPGPVKSHHVWRRKR